MTDWPITISLPQGLTVNGVTTWVLRVASRLADTGRDVRLVVHAAECGHAELPGVRAGLGTRVRIIPAPDLYDPMEWQACLRIYRDLLPTVLQPNVLAESYGLAAALAIVCPEQLRVVGWNHIDDAYDVTCLSYYEPAIHSFGTVSSHCATQLRQRIPTRAADIEYIPNGVPVPDEPRRPALAGRPLRLVYAGRMDQDQKRVFDLVSLAEELDRRGVRFELRLVGDGPQTAELQTRIARATPQLAGHGNDLRLELPVSLEAMTAVWSWADVSLLLSNREGFSLSMVESMACGCVPVVSRVQSGVGDVLVHERNGLTFPVGDVAAAASCVQWLAGHEAQRRAMSATARQSVRGRCNFERFIAGVAGVFDRAAGQPERPWPAGRPLRMNSADGAPSATIPSDAPDRLRRLLRHIAQAEGGPLAIYGAGNHTRALAAVWAAAPVEIVAVIDDEGILYGRRLWGWPILTPEQAAECGARSVVISSWMHEAEIWERHGRGLAAAGLHIYRLYSEAASELALAQV
jgi:glycosyltransferase involved in cell wall biosynthesis